MNSTPASCEAVDGRHSLTHDTAGWQQQLRDAITDADTLFDVLALPETHLPAARKAAKLFPLLIPRSFAARMRRGDIHDPLLRQVLPIAAEHDTVPGFSTDAVGDGASAAGDGLLHKYHGRALVITTGACAVNCRYCFRRHFDYSEHNGGRGRWRGVLERIAADASIEEVLLSGGDPLSLSDSKLRALIDGLAGIDHVRRVRIHSRQPVVLPARIDDGFMTVIEAIPQRRIMVIHANHANEINDEVAQALARLRQAGVLLLNQSVLLKGVNDDADTLADLSRRLFDVGVMPYYLHLLDRVAGTAHFETQKAQAVALMQALAARLPGYMVPKLARETAGAPAKSVIGYEY